jgi:hypothetical protein
LRHDPVLNEQVVDGDSAADDGQGEEVARDPVVVGERREERRDRERIHADPLVPAQLAGDEVRDLGEEEAPARRDRRDEEREPQLVAGERAPDGTSRARQKSDESEEDDERLAEDAEPGECDSDGVRQTVDCRRPFALLLAVLVVSLAVLAGPPTAAAHIRSSILAVDYRASVFPHPAAISARVYLSDRALRLGVAPGHRLVVLGYQGEPFLRLTSAGVEVNQGSLTAAGVGFATRSGGVGWRLRSRTPSVIWHDARLRGLPPGVERGRWTIPLVLDGRRVGLTGELVRVSRPATWGWFLLGVPFVVGAAVLLSRRRRPELRIGAVAFGLAATACMLVADAAFVFDTYASEGKWLEFGNVLVFGLVGAAFAVRGPLQGRAVAGGVLGLLALSIGLSHIPVFLHGLVLSGLGGGLTRTVVALTIWLGAAATVVGGAVFFDLLP